MGKVYTSAEHLCYKKIESDPCMPVILHLST